MDPQHASFLYRCESNPALYAQCQILWFGEFRRPTLQLIPKLIDGIATLITSSDMSEAYDGILNYDLIFCFLSLMPLYVNI